MHLMATIGSSGASRRWTRSSFPGLVWGCQEGPWLVVDELQACRRQTAKDAGNTPAALPKRGRMQMQCRCRVELRPAKDETRGRAMDAMGSGQ